jgi:hypothetical protein
MNRILRLEKTLRIGLWSRRLRAHPVRPESIRTFTRWTSRTTTNFFFFVDTTNCAEFPVGWLEVVYPQLSCEFLRENLVKPLNRKSPIKTRLKSLHINSLQQLS